MRIILHFQHCPVPCPLLFSRDLSAEPRPFTELWLSLERHRHCRISGFPFLCSQTPAVPKVAGSELAQGMCRSTPPCAQQCPSQGCQHPQQITSCAHCYHWHASGGADKIPLCNSIAAQEFHYLPISPTTPIPPREHQLGCCWSRDVCPKSSWNQALGENRTSVLPVEE